MKVSALAYAAVVGLALAGCSNPQQASQASRPTDTGNMAYPTPQPQGEIGSSMPSGRRRAGDTGSMAYPRPLPQGNIGTTQVR